MLKLANTTSVYRSNLIVKAYDGWIKQPQEVLDIGCGTGVVASEISERFKIKAVGCDIEKYLIRKMPFKLMKTNNELPFPDNSFDVAMLNDVLHHTKYENQEALIKESLRVAKAVLLFELKPTLAGKVADKLINIIHNPRMNIPYTYRDVKSWRKLFGKMNLIHRKRQVSRPFFYPFSHVAFKVVKK